MSNIDDVIGEGNSEAPITAQLEAYHSSTHVVAMLTALARIDTRV